MDYFKCCVCFLFLVETVSLDVGKLIQKGRMAKELSQKELATVSYISQTNESTWIKCYGVMIYVRKKYRQISAKKYIYI